MGSTEGNLTALWNAREYFKEEVEGKMVFKGKKPVCLWSHEGHYSLAKSADILDLEYH